MNDNTVASLDAPEAIAMAKPTLSTIAKTATLPNGAVAAKAPGKANSLNGGAIQAVPHPDRAKAKALASAPASPPSSAAKPIVDVVTLQALCNEMKLDPRLAREKLRIAVREPKEFPELAKTHKARQPWQWLRGSAAENDARKALL